MGVMYEITKTRKLLISNRTHGVARVKRGDCSGCKPRLIQLRPAGDIISNRQPAEIKRIATRGAREGRELVEALYTGSSWYTQREGESGKGAATQAPVVLSMDGRGLERRELQNAEGGTLQTTPRENGIASCTREHERVSS